MDRSLPVHAGGSDDRFELNYSGDYGERRSMVLHTVGHAWTQADIDRLEIDSEWVHLAPLFA